jgi:hypothetical protein
LVAARGCCLAIGLEAFVLEAEELEDAWILDLLLGRAVTPFDP